MKVKELAETLKNLDQDKDIYLENDFALCEITEVINSKDIWENTDVYVIS